MIYMNKPALPYFSSVVKNVANPNIEVKKLVYIYLLHYAESDPDLALLSVNAIQKSLSDQNPQVRALALRTMAGMRVPVISQIVSLAIKKGVADFSPQVRKAAALAIPKCYQLDPNTLPQLTEYLTVLLGDKQYFVVGPAVQVYLQLELDRIDILHKHYRGLVKKLVDMDEWSQLATIQVLLIYARKCFPRQRRKTTKTKAKGFYEDENGVDETEETDTFIDVIDPDLNLLLKACQLLLANRNAAVVVAAANCLVHTGTEEHIQETIGPLIALLRSSIDVQQVVLPNIVLVALKDAKKLLDFVTIFMVRHHDPDPIWRLKVELLTLIFPHANSRTKALILNELEVLAHSQEFERIREAVRAIGRCAQGDGDSSARCFKVLLDQITDFDNVLVSEVLTVIRHLIQRDPGSHKKTIVRLARNLDKTTGPEARATIIWLVGEYAGQDRENNIAPDVLRILIKGFADESEVAKQQIILLAAKVYLQYLLEQAGQETSNRSESEEDGISQSSPNMDHPIPKLWQYLLALVRYDTAYDLRDRMRTFQALLSDPATTQLASLMISAPKPVPQIPSPSERRQNLMLGSTTLALGRDEAGIHGLPGYIAIPPWVEAGSEPDPKLRDELTPTKDDYVSKGMQEQTVAASQRLDQAIKEQGLEQAVKKGTMTNKNKSLNDWLDESEEAEDSDEEESEDGEEESEEEESSGETEDGSSEDESTAQQNLISK